MVTFLNATRLQAIAGILYFCETEVTGPFTAFCLISTLQFTSSFKTSVPPDVVTVKPEDAVASALLLGITSCSPLGVVTYVIPRPTKSPILLPVGNNCSLNHFTTESSLRSDKFSLYSGEFGAEAEPTNSKITSPPFVSASFILGNKSDWINEKLPSITSL